MTPPSGRQFRISRGEQAATLVEVGGGLREYSVGGQPVVDGYEETAMCDGARGQTLVPWPNRLRDGAWSWHGRQLQLSLTEPDKHNAIHGLVRWASWSATAHDDDAVTLACSSFPQPGYPWLIEARNRWTLSDSGLRCDTTLTNHGDEPAPVGCGFHPYLTVGTATVDQATLRLPVRTRLLTDDQQIPVGREPVAGTDVDFRSPRPIAGLPIDAAFADLERDEDGLLRVELAGNGRRTTLWMDAGYSYVEIFTGDSLPDPARRRRGLGVEPMTMPPNGLGSGEGVVTLGPGEFWHGSWGIRSEEGSP